MKVGFTGTRAGMTDVQAAIFEGLLGPTTEFHHGSCSGADVEAARIVRKIHTNHVRIVAHPGPTGGQHESLSHVDDETREPKTHFARNRDIVNETDYLIACPYDMEEKEFGGTWFSVNYARKIGKLVHICWPDGSISSEKR